MSPARPNRRCTADPQCPHPALPGGKCADHLAAARRVIKARAADSYKVYNSRKWKRVRAAYLAEHPYCECAECAASTRPLPANEVDHIRPIERGGAKYDPANFEALAHAHHSRKTAREYGFGGAHE